jgi:cholesterol transport system auxiliary component
VQSFENAHLLASVGRADSRIAAPFALTSEIRRFEIDVARGEAVVEISAKLVADQSGRIVAAQLFSASVPGSASDGAAAAAALDAALTSVMSQIVVWAAGRA